MKKNFFLWIFFIFSAFVFMQCGIKDDGPFLTIERRGSVPSIKEAIIVRTVERVERKTDLETFLNFQEYQNSLKKDSTKKTIKTVME